jgi:hypothetical protein
MVEHIEQAAGEAGNVIHMVSAMRGRPMGAAFLALYAQPGAEDGPLTEDMKKALETAEKAMADLDEEGRATAKEISIHMRQAVRGLFEALARHEQVRGRDEKVTAWRKANPRAAAMLDLGIITTFAAMAGTLVDPPGSDDATGEIVADLMTMVREFRGGNGMSPRSDEERNFARVMLESLTATAFGAEEMLAAAERDGAA